MKKTGYILAGLIALACLSSSIYTIQSKEKTAYVNVSELYNEFDMKKEMEASYLNVEKGRQAQLDSLELELKLLNKKLQTDGSGNRELAEAFESKRENYLLKKEQYAEDNALMQQTYSSDIMKQLNQYVADFGKAHGYAFIFGAEGSGAVMYAEQHKEITAELKQYVNNMYKGKKR
jgi:outer membrane protein